MRLLVLLSKYHSVYDELASRKDIGNEQDVIWDSRIEDEQGCYPGA